MHEHEHGPTHYHLVRRYAASETEEAAREAAYQKTSSLLSSWRLNFAGDGYLHKRYPHMTQGDVTIQSPSPAQVHVETQSPDGTSIYDFDTQSRTLSANMFGSDGTPREYTGDFFSAHDELSRILFDCDNAESRGR